MDLNNALKGLSKPSGKSGKKRKIVDLGKKSPKQAKTSVPVKKVQLAVEEGDSDGEQI